MQQIQLVGITPTDFMDAVINGVKTQLLTELKKEFQPKIPEEFITRQMLADLLHVDISTTHNMRKRGVIKAYQISGKILFKRSEIEAAIVELKIRKKLGS